MQFNAHALSRLNEIIGSLKTGKGNSAFHEEPNRVVRWPGYQPRLIGVILSCYQILNLAKAQDSLCNFV